MHRMRKTTRKPHKSTSVVCVSNRGYAVSLEPRKVYEALPDEEAATHHQVRVIDESGEDYLYPESLFVAINLSGQARATAVRLPVCTAAGRILRSGTSPRS